MSTNQRTDITPFAGTRMAQVMGDRHELRRVRFEEYYRSRYETKKKPAAGQPRTPEQIVADSLATRPLADVPDVLLRQMLETPEVVQATYRNAHAHHGELVRRQAAAEKAQARIGELEDQDTQLDHRQQELFEQWNQAQRTLEVERNRSGFAKLFRGGKAEREAGEAMAEASAQQKQVRSARLVISRELQEQHQIVATAPEPREFEHAASRLEELTVLVQNVGTPEVVEAEVSWRRDASGEVARLDHQRRTPHRPRGATELFESITGTDEAFSNGLIPTVRQSSRHQHQSRPGSRRPRGLAVIRGWTCRRRGCRVRHFVADLPWRYRG